MYKGANGQMVYPEDIQCVVDSVGGRGGIYIGNLQASQNINTLKKHSIRGVLTSAKGVFLSHPKTDVPHHLYIPAEDHDAFDLSKYFDQAAEWIYQRLQETNILVHCLAGVSRSVSLVIAYLIKHKGMSFDDAFFLLKSRRKIIHPNDGFKRQLKQFEGKIKHGRSLSPQRHREMSPERSRYLLNYSPTKNYPEARTNYARETYSPSKNYEYKYYKPETNGFDRTSAAGNRDSSTHLRNQSSFYDIKEIDRKIQERRTSLHNGGRAKAYSDYNASNNTFRNQSGQSNVGFSNKAGSYQEMNSDLDKRIAEIRKKYQEYTDMAKDYPLKSNSNLTRRSSNSTIISEKYKNLGDRTYNRFQLDVSSNQNDNPEFGRDFAEHRMKKISSDYEKPIFGESLVGREYNYRYEKNEMMSYRNRPYTGIHMRKLLSYQEE